MGESSSSALGALSIFQGVSSFVSSSTQASAIRAQGGYESSVALANKKISDFQAEDAIRRGDKSAFEHGKQVRALIGKQRATYAAQGVDVGTGSAIEVQSDTDTLGKLGSLVIKSNAAREAFGYQTQSMNYASQSAFALASAKNQSNNTLLTGGMNAIASGIKAGYYFKGGGSKDEKVSSS